MSLNMLNIGITRRPDQQHPKRIGTSGIISSVNQRPVNHTSPLNYQPMGSPLDRGAKLTQCCCSVLIIELPGYHCCQFFVHCHLSVGSQFPVSFPTLLGHILEQLCSQTKWQSSTSFCRQIPVMFGCYAHVCLPSCNRNCCPF